MLVEEEKEEGRRKTKDLIEKISILKWCENEILKNEIFVETNMLARNFRFRNFF